MKKNFKKLLVVVTAAAMLVSLSACSGSDKGSNTGNKGKDSVTFNIDWPAAIDPGVGSKSADTIAMLNLYDSLTYPNTDGSVEPLLASKWDVNDSSTEYTFHLNKAAKFHSGNAVKASDVKFSMDRLITMGEGYAYLFTDLLKSTEAVDDQTVKFTLNSPSGTFPNMLIRLYVLEEDLVMKNLDTSKDTYGQMGDYGKTWLQTNDAGSGPYKVKEMRTEDSLTMEKSEDYWQGWDQYAGAPTTAVMMGNLDGTTVRTMITRDELDLTDDTQTNESLKAMTKADGVELVRTQTGNNFNIALNTKSAPTDDIHVRKAMAYALDYDQVCESIYPGSTKATGPILAGIAGSLDTNPYAYDLDKAKAELKQSKYYDDLISGKKKITLTYCSEGGDNQEKLALLMQSGLDKIGVTCEIAGKPFATMMTDAATVETTPNAAFVVFAGPYLDGGVFLKSRYHSSSCGSWEQMEWLQSDKIDKEITDAMAIADEKERTAAYEKISEELIDLCPTIWVGDIASSFAYRSDNIVKLPVAEKFASGKSFVYAGGYSYYLREFEVKK